MTQYVAVDLETWRIQDMRDGFGKVHCIAICHADAIQAHVYPAEEFVYCLELLKTYITGGMKLVFHNAAYDVPLLRALGLRVDVGQYVDTMVLGHCIDPQRKSHSLKSYGEDLGVHKIDYPQALVDAGLWEGDIKNDMLYNVGFNDVMAEYAKQDVRVTMALWNQQLEHLEADPRMSKGYYDVHLPYVEVMISLQQGLHVDLSAMMKLTIELMGEIERASAEFAKCYPSAGKLRWDAPSKKFEPVYKHGAIVREPVNIQSPNQVVSLLVEHGWQPEEFKWGTGRPVTSQAVLRRLIVTPGTPPGLVELATQLSSLRSLYGIQAQCIQVLKLADVHTGLLKPSWRQASTVTGRMSCSEPNAQNFSTRHPVWGKRMRQCFTPPKGYAMLCGDLSQIELGILAWYLEVLCDDSGMADGNRQGRDAHDVNTENWYGVRKDESPQEFKQRRAQAKNGIFASSYGAMAKRLSLTLCISIDEATEILYTVDTSTKISLLKQRLWDLMRETRDVKPVKGKRHGFFYDCLNNRHWYPDISSGERGIRGSAERQSFNCLMQGGCASVMFHLLNQCMGFITLHGGWIAGVVHDEALIYIPHDAKNVVLSRCNIVFNSLTLPSSQGGVQVRADFAEVNNWSEK